MKAVYYEGSGNFKVGPCEPQQPTAGEVRLNVAYCGVCGTDLHIAQGHMDQRVRTPQVIGHEMAGTIAETGPGVEGFEIGDAVVVRPLDARGETPADKGQSHISRKLKFLGIDSPGAFQASWTVPAFTLHHLPGNVDLRLAALAEPLAVACHDVRRSELAPGETAVVIGGGPIGTLIALVARATGARVVLAEVNQVRRELSQTLGIETVDPGRDDLAATVMEMTDGFGADVVFEVSGSGAGALAMTQAAGLRGRVVVVAIFPQPQPVSLFDVFWKELQFIGARVYEVDDYERAIGFIATGGLPLEPLISATEPLERLPQVLTELPGGPAMKVLVDCQS